MSDYNGPYESCRVRFTRDWMVAWLPEGAMSPPVWHMHCRWCDARASVTQWKHPIAEGHPANGCLWALAQADTPAKETP